MRSGFLFLLVLILHISVSTFAYDWSTNPGDGSPGNPYQISEPNHLMSIGSDAALLDKQFILTNDIIFDPNNNPEHVFDRALIAPFSGSFDGDHHVIRNFKTNTNSTIGQLGIFDGVLGTGAVKNLKINNASINASENIYHHGVLAGNNEGIILNCSVQGSVSGRLYLGGLVGWNTGKIQSCSASVSIVGVDSSESLGGLVGDNVGEIHNCKATGPVTSGLESQWLGGLVGFTGGGEILSCYATGDVTAGYISSDIGGLIGYNWAYSEIIECYATGRVSWGEFSEGIGGLIGVNDGTIQQCFFLNTSGPDNGYGTPLDDSNIMIQSNFTNWDFVGESTNGSNDIWRMCIDDVDYPRLSWEFAQNGDFACGDGVDIFDLQALAEHWLLTEITNPTVFSYACDANGDGVIDMADYAVLGENW
jgi:hypothetical protein